MNLESTSQETRARTPTSGYPKEFHPNARAEVRKERPQALAQGKASLSFRETLNRGSKTFSLASLFFSSQTYRDVSRLYSWCRACDDITDGSVLGFDQDARGLPIERVDLIWEKTLQAIQAPQLKNDPEFEAFGSLLRDYKIPLIYAQDLIEGMRHDALHRTCKTQEDLFLYCYRVAGVVGLMMTHLIGIKSSRALKNAVSLGIALQLTNILRDIGDDFRVGRLYLPTDWLDDLLIPHDEIMDTPHRECMLFIMRRLQVEAYRHYQIGLEGLIDLPFRAALAVSVAACNYQMIGDRVLELAPHSLKTRTLLSRWDRVKATSRGIGLVLLSLPHRLRDRRPLVKITEIWRPQ